MPARCSTCRRKRTSCGLKYGRTTFGQSCLIARRLIEKGVRFITINYGGWDTHKEHFEAMRQMLPQLDKGLATLLEDLAAHGLLDSTIVWCSGEFGRTPQVQWEAPWNGGRNHFGAVFSTLIAGGGFKGGAVVGASDAQASAVEDRPVYPWDLVGSMYALMGIDPDSHDPTSAGHGRRLAAQGERRSRSRRPTEGNHVIPRRRKSCDHRYAGLCVRALVWVAGTAWLRAARRRGTERSASRLRLPGRAARRARKCRATVGGQYLKDTTEVLVTGQGIQATIGKHKRPLNEGRSQPSARQDRSGARETGGRR